MNICIFGDSLTWGAFLPFRVAWANLLRNYLESKNKRIALYDLGIDANTTADVLKRFEIEAKARPPKVIIFAIGVNDSAYRKTEDSPVVPLEEFKENVNKLISLAQGFTDKILFVGLAKGDDGKTTPLPQSTTGKCYTKERVKIYNNTLREECAKLGIGFIDVYSLLSDEDFDDGLHANITGHVKIFEAVRTSLLNSAFLDDLS